MGIVGLETFVLCSTKLYLGGKGMPTSSDIFPLSPKVMGLPDHVKIINQPCG